MVKIICDTFTKKKNIRNITFMYDCNNPNDKLVLDEINKLIDKLQPSCFNCVNYFREGYFCGYRACMCKIHGCLEYPSNPHYDCDGSKCDDYRRVDNG